MRPPTGRMLRSAVLVRTDSGAAGNVRGVHTIVYTTTARRASVQGMTLQEAQAHGLDGSKQPFALYFAPPDPGVGRDDLIVVPVERAGDPEEPAAGDVWVETSASPRVVRWFDGAGVVTLCAVPAPGDATAIDVAGDADLTGAMVLSCAGPAEDAARQGVQFKVVCEGRT